MAYLEVDVVKESLIVSVKLNVNNPQKIKNQLAYLLKVNFPSKYKLQRGIQAKMVPFP